MAIQVTDEVLMTSEGLFGRLHHFAPLTDEQEGKLVERARAGDETARHELILSVLRLVVFKVRSYCRGSVAWRIEFEDVMQQAYISLWEGFEKLLAARCSCAWMLEHARHTVEDYVHQVRSLVCLPPGASYVIPEMMSIDVPVNEELGLEWADRLEAPSTEMGSSVDHAALYQGIDALPAHLKHAIVEFYNLELECGVVEGVSRTPDERRNDRTHAKRRLRRRLREAYPQYAGEYRAVRVRPGYVDMVINAEQLRRLQAAYQELVDRGEPVNGRVMARRAQVSDGVALAYLYRVKQQVG